MLCWAFPSGSVNLSVKGSLHLHVAQQQTPFHTSLQHPGTETSACDPATVEKEREQSEHTNKTYIHKLLLAVQTTTLLYGL